MSIIESFDNSRPGEILFEHHLKIDNTRLSPDAVADLVIRQFGLARREDVG